MKWVLKLFPRTWLINVSLRIRPLLKIYYRGTRFTDPIDGSSYRKFLSYGYKKLRPNALCPGTLSLERHRLLWLYLTRKTTLLETRLNVLHIAPEQIFYSIFKTYNHWNYTTADLYSPLADVKADICRLPFKDGQFDLILCNHVMEHVKEDQKAMGELFRVLKKGGTLIAQVPLDKERLLTYEDKRITRPEDRAVHFGQYDHVRIYGMDYYNRLNTAGFVSQAVDLLSELSEDEKKRYALPKEECIPIGKKP